MNKGAEVATGEILLFLHADTLLPNNALEEIHATFEDKSIVAGAFDLSFDTKDIFLELIAKGASLRTRFTKLPYGDQAIFIRKKTFNELKGYEEFLLMEDIHLMQKIKTQNYKIKILEKKVITSARKWQERGIIYTTLRNWFLQLFYFLGVHPNKLSKFYK